MTAQAQPHASNSWNPASIFFAVATASLVTYILSVGSSILIPIVVAALFWFALDSLARLFQSLVPVFPTRAVLSHILAWALLIVIMRLIFSVINGAVAEFQAELPDYQANLVALADTTTTALRDLSNNQFAFLNLEIPDLGETTRQIVVQLRESIPDVAGTLLGLTQNSIVLISTVLIYLIFFYSESSSFAKKLAALNRVEAEQQRWSALISLIVARLASYIRIKTLTSALTGGLGYILMASLNVNFALVFALLLFLLNYIPVVGSLISSLLPIIFFLVDPNFFPAGWFILATGLLLIQQGIGSVLEPRLLANSFNISSILVMTSLVFWGAIWGIFGMLISTPFTAALVILAANFQGSRSLAILMSADGNIESLRPRG